MTNIEIVTNAAIEIGLFDEDQVEQFFDAGLSLPLFTYAEWKKRGYKVKKGEKASLAVPIWQKAKKKDVDDTDDTTDDGTVEVKKNRFYKKLSFFFLPNQVEAIQ